MENVKVVILAGGIGKRMGDKALKPLVEVGGKSMLERVGTVAREATGTTPIVVIGHGGEIIRSAFGKAFTYAMQEKQIGTADALRSAKSACGDAKRIIVLYGDHPFVSVETIKKLFKKSEETNAEITLAVTEVPHFEDDYKVFNEFARISRHDGKILAIREYKDASESEKALKEVNPGYYVFRADWLWSNLPKIKNNNAQKEFYLTDLLSLAQAENLNIENITIPAKEALGANSKEDLEILERFEI